MENQDTSVPDPENNQEASSSAPAETPQDRGSSSFSVVLEALKKGEKAYRDGWNGKGMWIHLQTPDEHSKMGLPYLYMSTVDGKLVPWLASQTDILADDWFLTR